MRSRGVAVGLLLAIIVIAFMRGELSVFSSGVPGQLGDNVAFVWNTWWAARAWHQFPALLQTSMLFAPWGTDLTLHTHTLLPSSLAAALAGSSVIVGTNIVVAAHLGLNGLCAYALAFHTTRRAIPSCVAAVVFAWSPYVAEHLLGHYNLIAAWVLPLFVLQFLRTLELRGLSNQIVLGVVLGCIAYIDYYYLVYATTLGILMLAHRSARPSGRSHAPASWQRRALALLGVLLIVDLAVITTVSLTGGGALRIAGATVSIRGIENPAAAIGLIAMFAAAIWFGPRLRGRFDRAQVATDLRDLRVAAIVAAVVLGPLLVSAALLWSHGGYVTQTYYWRSAPAGIDIGTLVLGNPAGALSRAMVAGIYERLGIDAIERVAWLGPGVIALCAVAITRRQGPVRMWLAIGIVFGLWALGPRLQAFGHDLHALLPAAFVRYVPVASNARIPARAVIVVYLATAILAAIGTEALLARGRRGLALTAAALVALDFVPAAPPAYRPDHPAIYDTLARDLRPGTVCELPLGLRDGFGEIGRLDMRVLYYQTIHQRPITGGFVARLDPRLVRKYQDDPVLGVLLRLSDGGTQAAEHPLPSAQAGNALLGHGIRFVVMNEDAAPAELRHYVAAGLPLHAIARDGSRVLYEIGGAATATSERRSP